MILFTILALFGFLKICIACGGAVHNEVSERARAMFLNQIGDEIRIQNSTKSLVPFSQILSENLASLQAGSTFPDWGYGCFGFDEAAEVSHWTPFLMASVSHIKEKYTQPYDEKARKFIAFVFGIASHQIADELWHSLFMEEGFLGAIVDMDFLRNRGDAHNNLDIGGDLLLRTFDSLNYLLGSWDVPTEDLIQVYSRLNFTISSVYINTCMARQYYAVQTVKKIGHTIYSTYASKSPVMVDQFDSYSRGGLYSMAVQTYSCWSCLSSVFEDNVKECNCLNYDFHNASAKYVPDGVDYSERFLYKQNKAKKFMEIAKKYSSHKLEDVTIFQEQHTGSAVIFSDTFKDMYEQGVGNKESTRYSELNSSSNFVDQFSSNRASNINSFFKKTHEDPSINEKPGVLESECEDLNTQYSDKSVLFTKQPYSMLGESVVFGSFFGNKSVQVAISAPFYCDVTEHKSCGAVFILNLDDYNMAQSENEISKIALLTLYLPIKSYIDGENVECLNEGNRRTKYTDRASMFGASLLVSDINNDGIDDLIVGAPWVHSVMADTRGQVLLYLGSKEIGLAHKPSIVLDSRDLENSNKRKTSISRVRIGEKLFSGDVFGTGKNYLIVGAPNTNLNNKLHQAGAVFIFKVDSKSQEAPRLSQVSALTSKDPVRYEWFGSSVAILNEKNNVLNKTILVIGSPGFNPTRRRKNDRHTGLNSINDQKIQPQFDEKAQPLGPYKLGKVAGYTADKFTLNIEYATSIGEFGAFGMFGSQLVALPNSDGNYPDLIISAHTLDADNYSVQNPSKNRLDLARADSFQLPLLEGGWQSGSAYLSSWALVNLNNSETSITTNIYNKVEGESIPGHFGATLACDQDTCFIGEPLSGYQSGKVYIFSKSNQSLSGYTLKCIYNPDTKESRFGSGISAHNIEEGGVKYVAVSQGHDSSYSRLAGSVFLLKNQQNH